MSVKEKIREILIILGMVKEFDDDENLNMNARIEIRCTEEEKTLIKKYCEFQGISVSKFIRNATENEIDRFLVQYD